MGGKRAIGSGWRNGNPEKKIEERGRRGRLKGNGGKREMGGGAVKRINRKRRKGEKKRKCE